LLSLLVLGDTYLVHTGTGTAAAADDHTTLVLLIGLRILLYHVCTAVLNLVSYGVHVDLSLMSTAVPSPSSDLEVEVPR
jgi:hypothetical protein